MGEGEKVKEFHVINMTRFCGISEELNQEIWPSSEPNNSDGWVGAMIERERES